MLITLHMNTRDFNSLLCYLKPNSIKECFEVGNHSFFKKVVKCVWLVKRTFLMTKIDPPPNDRCLLFFIKAMRSSKIFLVFVRDISTTAPYMALHFQFSSLAIFILNLL